MISNICFIEKNEKNQKKNKNQFEYLLLKLYIISDHLCLDEK